MCSCFVFRFFCDKALTRGVLTCTRPHLLITSLIGCCGFDKCAVRHERSWRPPCCSAQPCNSNTAIKKPAETKSVRKSKSVYTLYTAFNVPVRVRLALRR